MKRFTILCIALLGLTMLHANVISGTCGENLTWQYDTDSHALVISGSGDMYDYYYDGIPCPWKTIAASIASVTLPDGLTRIGSFAFDGCQNITTIDFPATLLSIGEKALRTTGLKSVVIPNSVTQIGDEAFGNTGLQSVVLPNNLQKLESYTFYGCYYLHAIIIPASVVKIGADVFSYCEDVFLESSTPATITSSTFKSDVVLHVPCNSVSAYQAAPIWQFLNIMGNLDYNFTLDAEEGGSARITKSVCEANTVVIEATADAGYRFKSWSDGNTDNPRAIVLTADKAVTAQFEQSTTYYQVNISGFGYMVIRALDRSFYGPNWSGQLLEGTEVRFEAITNCGTFAGWSDGSEETYRNVIITSDTTITANFTGIETYEVSITAGEHGRLSFSKVGTITSCESTFETYAIADDGYHFIKWSDGHPNSWRQIDITSDTTIYAIFAKGDRGGQVGDDLYWSYEQDEQQMTISGSGEMWSLGFNGFLDEDTAFHHIESLIIEEGATTISTRAFKNFWHLQTAELPSTLTRIDESAFEDCRSLQSVTLATPSSLTYIGDWAFYNCHELESLSLPEGVTTIGKAAFYGCAYLQQLSLPASVQTISNNAFALCSRLKKITVDAVVPPTIAEKTFFEVSPGTPVYVPLPSVSDYVADPYWGRMNIIGAETSVENTLAPTSLPSKQLVNGQLFILRDGKTYTVQGLQIK